jgi:hypothetical protein
MELNMTNIFQMLNSPVLQANYYTNLLEQKTIIEIVMLNEFFHYIEEHSSTKFFLKFSDNRAEIVCEKLNEPISKEKELVDLYQFIMNPTKFGIEKFNEEYNSHLTVLSNYHSQLQADNHFFDPENYKNQSANFNYHLLQSKLKTPDILIDKSKHKI